MRLTHSHPHIAAATLLALCLIGITNAQAKDYQIEAVVFANNQPHTAYESTQYKDIAEIESSAETWALEPSMLLDEAAAINSSSEFTLLAHYSWGQEVLPSSEAALFSVGESNLNGWLKIYASHLLFANLDLDYNGYRMTEKRRLKLNEKHFFDHPKFGVLLRVSRLVVSDDDDTLSNDVEPSQN